MAIFRWHKFASFKLYQFNHGRLLRMRLVGKRMASHLTPNELIALTSLAAAVGLPILSFDKGLIPAIAVALIVVPGLRIISTLSCLFQRRFRPSGQTLTLYGGDCYVPLFHVVRKPLISYTD